MKLFLLLLVATISSSHAYHILCVFPVPSHSHNQLGKGVVDALLKEGHEVTWVTPFPEKAPKTPPKSLHIISVKEIQKFMHDFDMSDMKSLDQGLAFVKEFSHNVTMTALKNAAVRDTIVKVQFDAVVTEVFFTDIMTGIAAIQQVPWILLMGNQMMPSLEAQVDEIRSVTTIPLLFNEASVPMNFKERVLNVFLTGMMTAMTWWERPNTIAVYEEIFSPLAKARNVPLPPFEDAFHNVSILLVNAHESLSPAFSTPPNVINVAGYHIDENPPPLPKDLQEILDKSTQGVIYFSLGSVLKSAGLQPHTRKALLEKFAALPYTVLWKFEVDLNEKLPPNVHIRPWMPQLSILSHPNVKVFITHGGQLSTLEAVRAGVPLVAIPVFGDQHTNAAGAQAKGYALKVDFGPDMADELDQKLREVLRNPKYTQRVKYLSKLFRGRPVPPAKLVSYYIQHAIETKGAFHLRSVSLKYTFIERWMLDLLLLVVTAIFTIVLLLRSCLKLVCGKSKADKKKDSKKKRN